MNQVNSTNAVFALYVGTFVLWYCFALDWGASILSLIIAGAFGIMLFILSCITYKVIWTFDPEAVDNNGANE